MKEYNDQITELDPRRELPSVVRYLSADRLMGIIEQAQNGDTRELFALYRDIITNDNQVRSEFFKRKIAVLGDPVTVIPFKKADPADVDDATLCGAVIENATFADAQSWLMNATLFPVAVVEKVFAPLPSGGFALKALVPVHYQLLDYSQGAMRIFDVDDAGTPLHTSHEVTPERYIVHRCDLMPAPDNWGGAMRSILFWWLLRTMSRQWWADLLERFGVPFLKGKYRDEQGRATLERAFRLAVRLGALVISDKTETEVVQAANGDASNSHERFITLCNQEISKLIVGQTLSSTASPTGELGGGTANLQGEVRDDIRKADAKALAATLRGQLFEQLLAINGHTGRAPKILFGSESAREQAATLTVIGKLHEAGLEPDDDALNTLSERIGFGIRRAAPPQSPMLPFSAVPWEGRDPSRPLGEAALLPLSAADSVEDRPAATRADDLAQAFADDLAPLQSVIAASTSPEDCIRRVEAWVEKHNPANAADVIEKALYVYSMAGARSARPRSVGTVRGDSSPLSLSAGGYDPSQPRNADGEWTSGGGSSRHREPETKPHHDRYGSTDEATLASDSQKNFKRGANALEAMERMQGGYIDKAMYREETG